MSTITIADAEAVLFVDAGYRYYCNAGNAPPELVAYRNDPKSGWIPTSKNGHPPRDNGHGKKYGNKPRSTNVKGLVVSHWYVGQSEIPAPEDVAAQTDTSAPGVTSVPQTTTPEEAACAQ